MASLTQTAYFTRRIVKFAFIGAVSIIVFRAGWGVFRVYWRNRHPLPPPIPTVAFGKLPALDFGQSKPRPSKELILETVDGRLPNLPSQAKVFFIPAQESRFLALEKANQIAQNLGFALNPEKISEDLYLYRNEKLNTTFKINPLTKVFLYSYPYLKDQTLLVQKLPPQQELINQGVSFLEKTGLLHPDLSGNNAQITLWRMEGEKTLPALSLSEAHLAQVDFFRDPIDNQYPIYPQNLEQANVSLLLSGASGKQQVVEARYAYFLADQSKAATYPLKEINQAWEEVKRGSYHLAEFDRGVEEKTIPIRRVYLAYFDPHYPTNFLQPIYVFEGDYNFSAFVSAISIEWVSE